MKQAQRRAAAGRSRHKSQGVIPYEGSYFPTRCPKWIFITPIVLVEKKHTKLIYHMPWLYQYPPLPFHRSYKNQSKILKIFEKQAQRRAAADLSRHKIYGEIQYRGSYLPT